MGRIWRGIRKPLLSDRIESLILINLSYFDNGGNFDAGNVNQSVKHPKPLEEDDDYDGGGNTPGTTQPDDADGDTAAVWIERHEGIILAVSILVFGAVIVALAMRDTAKKATVDQKLRFYATIMVITMASFLVVAGYGKEQIAASLGLLGTIAGYLLGRQDNAAEKGSGPETPEHEDV